MSKPEIKLIKMIAEDERYSDRIIRVAIYARYSSTGNSPYSAEEQIQRIRHRVNTGTVRSRRFPNAKIEIQESWVLRDEAKTGRTTPGRAGYELIKSGIANRSFDMVLMDDISRMTRDMGDTIDLYETLEYAGIEGFSVADAISTQDPNARDLFIFKGYANEHQSKATSKNTIRGLEIRAINGFSTGHNPFGYCSAPTKNSLIRGTEKPSHFAIAIDHEQAKTVVRIWEMFAGGIGCHTIAATLNSEGVTPSMRGKRKASGPKEWSEKSVWNILRQDKYVGIWKYRQTKVVKNPTTVRLIQKERPKEEWLVAEREDLRIVPVDLEKRVRARQAGLQLERGECGTGKSNFGRQGNTAKHLFIGTMKCAECGGNFVLVSGKKGGYLGCWNAHRETKGVCQNRRTVQMSWVEQSLIDEIKIQIDLDKTYQVIADRYNAIMKDKHSDVPKRLLAVETTLTDLNRRIANFTDFIGCGNFSDAISKSLLDSEALLTKLLIERDFLLSQSGGRTYITPEGIKQKMGSLDDILGLKRAEANGLLRKLFPDKITMTPDPARPRAYIASGELSLFAMMKFKKHVIGVPKGIRTPVFTVKG